MTIKIKTWILLCLFALVFAGCQSGINNVAVSRNSEMGRAIAEMDERQKHYSHNVPIYRRAMEDYEKAQGNKCGTIDFVGVSEPLQIVEPHVFIHHLEGRSTGCGYKTYKVKITCANNSSWKAKKVEILERAPNPVNPNGVQGFPRP